MPRSFGNGIRVGVRKLFTVGVPSVSRSRNSLRSEIHAHIDERVAYLTARGVDEATARQQAIARFGGDLDTALAMLEESAAVGARRAAWHERAESLAQDARFVLRGLGRAPTFTAGVVLTLALGLGINSAVFRIADRVLTRPPSGVVDAGALRRVTLLQSNGKAAPVESQLMSYPQARTIADSKAFSQSTLYASARGLQWSGGRELAALYVDSGYFKTLGVRPAAGRFFDVSEAAPGAGEAVAVASYEFWNDAMGAVDLTSAPPLRINEKPYRVIGVTPRGFSGVDLDPVDVWLPFGVAVLGRSTINGTEIPWYKSPMVRAIRVIGRMAGGVTDARAAAQAGAAVPAATESFAGSYQGVRLAGIHQWRGAQGADVSEHLLARLIAVAIAVLIIACANAANLLLARGLRRRRELAVRLALGAARMRIIRLLVMESMLLGLLGGAAAALTGYWMGDALRRLVFPDARWTTSALDDRALVFTSLIALVAGLAAGLAPALQLTTPDLANGLKDNRYQPGRRTNVTRAALIILQTAFSLFLLVASGLLVRSLQRLNDVDLGFNPRGLITIDLPQPQFGGAVTTSGPRIESKQLAERLQGQPGVQLVALSSNAPFGSHASMGVSVPGRPEPEIPPSDGPWYSVVSASYFPALGMHLVRGRFFNAGDMEGSQPAVIINESMARYYWRDADPFQSCVLARGMCARVVGVVRDVRDFHSGGAPPPRYYYALSQQPDTAVTVVVRTTSEAVPALVQQIKAMTPPSQRVTTQVIEDRVSQAMRPWRVATLLFATLGAVALALSCIGVYSVMSYITSERIPEMGVRMVLGATSADLVGHVLAGGLRLVGAGVLLGLAGAAAGARLLSALLFGVSPMDPVVYAAAGGALLLAGVVATLVPALRVLRTDPTVALRAE